MKRLHIVGTSTDHKRLYLAPDRDAPSGSYEVSIDPELLRMVEEAREHGPERDGAGPAEEPGASANQEPGDIDIPIAPQRVEGPVPAATASVPPATAGPEDRAADQAGHDGWTQPRRERPAIPEHPHLTAAEIQTLIRSGRGVRAVARAAGTPVDWVRYLADPIQQERRGVVTKMLGSRQSRSRLGPSGEVVGEAVIQNLRGRGVKAPERLLEGGFTAYRLDGRDPGWRVRLEYEHRGQRHTARWIFDPHTSEVIPANTLASQLGWRRPRARGRSAPRPAPPRGDSARSGRRAAPKGEGASPKGASGTSTRKGAGRARRSGRPRRSGRRRRR